MRSKLFMSAGRIAVLVTAILVGTALLAAPAHAATGAGWHSRYEPAIEAKLNGPTGTKWCAGTIARGANILEQTCLMRSVESDGSVVFENFTFFTATGTGTHYVQVKSIYMTVWGTNGTGQSAFSGACGTHAVVAGQSWVCVSTPSFNVSSSFYVGIDSVIHLAADGVNFDDETPYPSLSR